MTERIKRKCEKCGEMAEFIAGRNTGDMKLHQYHCPKCHYTFICEGQGRFIREGYLPDNIYL